MQSIPEHYQPDPLIAVCPYLVAGFCYWCCQTCNTDRHQCSGCGDDLDHNGRESNGQEHRGCTE